MSQLEKRLCHNEDLERPNKFFKSSFALKKKKKERNSQVSRAKLKIKNNFMFQDLIALNHVNDCYQFFNYFNFFLVVIYLFFTVLGLHSCTGSSLVAGSGGYSSCSTWASHCSEKRASLAAEHML